MLNQCILVGRIKDFKDETLTLAINRSFKNEKGIYETDMINIEIKGKIAENLKDFCTKGDLVGIRGSIRGGNKIFAEKVTFLGTKKKD